MTEFDFEELDKAVGAALGDNQGRSSEEDRSRPLERAPQPRSVPERSSRPPVARRASLGRFMDVVHPSSDMRSNGPSVSPLAATPAPARVSVPAFEIPEASQVPEVVAEEPSSEFVSEIGEFEVETSAPESPFIPDAVVEKRPLGVAPPAVELPTIEDAHEESQEAILLEAEGDIPATPEPVEDAPSVDVASAEVAPQVEGGANVNADVTEQAATEPEEAPVSIFDTPVAGVAPASAKKKSKLVVLLWILALLVLGLGAGVAVYFFVLPML